jgi:hypothetical protein
MSTVPSSGPRPVCYMVMPFRRKKVEEPRPDGAPVDVDFDALWDRAYSPAIAALGYLPMRADFDAASAIVKAMLERIAFADLVLADVTLGNGNVYYEIGIRHAAKDGQCVLIGPTWCRPLFDISQFASIRFPLASGDVPAGEADVIRDLLIAKIPAIRNNRSPYFELVGEAMADAGRRSAFAAFAQELSAFQAQIKAVRLESDAAKRRSRLTDILTTLPATSLEIPEVAIDLVGLVRDTMDWNDVRQFIERLPERTRKLAFIREQHLLAIAESGDPQLAIAQLEALIAELGDTPERRGLIGGRYKRLWRAARKARTQAGDSQPSLDELRYLEHGIEHYTAGMELDYNEYYCSCNLPALLRARGDEGDPERATVLEHFVVAACERAGTRGSADEYLRPTLLGAAFRAGDVKRAMALAKQVRLEGASRWKLQSLVDDLREAIRQTQDDAVRMKLEIVFADLVVLVAPAAET